MWTGWLKLLRGKLLAARWARRFAFVLAIGGIGCGFFERIGFPRWKIVPFGYYLDVPPLGVDTTAHPSTGEVRLISAGQLIRRKGVDLLIRACVDLPATGWRLDIYGDGPERRVLERLAGSMRLSERIIFHGVVSNEAVHAALAQANCAVLPSRFDGWGMLVNEALTAGTPVICTDACGAATIVTDDRAGRIVPAGRVASLSAALTTAVARGRVQPEDRVAINAHASRYASADQAARRFMEAVSHG